MSETNDFFSHNYLNRELRIFQRLSQLQRDKKCFNFITILRWVKASFPPFAFEEPEKKQSSSTSGETNENRDTNIQSNEDIKSRSKPKIGKVVRKRGKQSIYRALSYEKMGDYIHKDHDVDDKEFVFNSPMKFHKRRDTHVYEDSEAFEEEGDSEDQLRDGECMYYVLEYASKPFLSHIQIGVEKQEYKSYVFQVNY